MNNDPANFPFPAPLIKLKRRRSLLPWWIIGFTWLFILFLAIIPVGVVFGLLKHDFNVSLLGFQTDDPFSVIGLCLILLFILKGIVALGLWTEKKWAVGLAKIDAIISIVVCCLSMVGPLLGLGHAFTIRLELIVLVPYFYKMNSIQYDWLYFDDQATDPNPEEISKPL
ncbi:MAG TPA: hypothetical protein VHZ50_14320 [Puia sp.]|nr:hypothetical protein [Puia sp.]